MTGAVLGEFLEQPDLVVDGAVLGQCDLTKIINHKPKDEIIKNNNIMVSYSNNNKSILIIGATGETGLEITRQLVEHHSKPAIHALARDPSKLQSQKFKLAGIVQGNARDASDIEHALEVSQADWVIVCVGNGDNVGKNDIRTANAKATVSVLQKPAFQHVRAMVVSSTGAGSSKIIVGLGIGALISHHLRHILADHTSQESAFAAIPNRTTIVRATALTSDQATGKVVTFGDTVKSPSIKTDRADLVAWMVNEICDGGTPTMPKGGIVNVTSVKK